MVGLFFIGRPVLDWRCTDPCLVCYRYPRGAVGSSARLLIDRGSLARLPAALVPAARGPGRPGLLRGRQGGQEAGLANETRGFAS